ncbi:DUF1214 domain-containing protein [Dietzia aurantiaca]|uniref:DUF1254 domain-containing protein n=1 Tax=Dietzia aurantiaca TaxID=983873 RepID=UPI001E329173|nr:DUF1214 domain-containing protein [Dietzia aurantiaca]MCD2264463.1 DUF1214 domain-containing protein [Dietzia aurantiaca]
MSSDAAGAYESLVIWGYPLVRFLELREKMTQAPVETDRAAARSAAASLGRFGHQKLLSDPSYRVGVAPNVDTLYSVAWVDLADGDLVLDTPDFDDRYYAFQFGYFDTSCHTVGQRTHGGSLGPVTIRWCQTAAESRVDTTGTGIELSCNSRFLMIAGRIMVDSASADDMSRVHALQEEIGLTRISEVCDANPALRGGSPEALEAGAGPGRRFFDTLSQMLSDIPDRALDPGTTDLLRAAGWQPGGAIGRGAADSELDDAVARGLAAIRRGIAAVGDVRNGWMINYRGVDFGSDWLLRASVAMAQIYINPAEEALYPVLERDAVGDALDGRHVYRLHFPHGELPPVEFFWSLTMYHAEGFLVENAISRYAIGDRSEYLRYGSDGSLDVVISHDQPARGQGNWLPAPPGEFRLMLRLYGPTPSVLQGQWRPPALVRL